MKQKFTHLGFCNRCNQQVFLTRKDFDVCLAFVLAIFTFGIGLLIYLAIYYRNPENRCSICGSQETTSQVQGYQTPTQPQFQNQKQSIQIEETENGKISRTVDKFCAFCGEKMEDWNSRFCENCGSKIEKK